jgi:pyruvate-formate lyase-activating enzyme
MPRGKNHDAPIPYSCNVPYRAVTVDFKSNCLICTCDGWLPIPVGKVENFNSLEEIWNSQISKIIQQDIEEKKYTWCAVGHCGVKNHNVYQTTASLAINIDDSCNLACPSCRRENIMLDSGPEFEYKLANMERILSWLEKYEHDIVVTLSGNGDPLASHIIRPLFKNYRPKQTQKFILHTNGLLIKKQLVDSVLLPYISWINLSVDAGCEETYKLVRRGGSWKVLIENFKFLKDMGLNKKTTLKFAVQKTNYQDIVDFVALCQEYEFKAHIHQLDDWGTWISSPVANPDSWSIANGTLMDHDVLAKHHPDYQNCKGILLKIHEQYKPPTVYIDNVVMEKLR